MIPLRACYTVRNVLKEERHRRILDLLGEEGQVVAAALSERLNVSDDTIRRDLQELDQEGRIVRVHGGALTRAPRTLSYKERSERGIKAKTAIGRAAAALVKRSQTVFIDGGTTTLHVARALPPGIRITVVTNSPPLALELVDQAEIEIVLLGGTLLKEGQVVVGPDTVEQIRKFRADLFFLGTCAIHPKHGITVPHLEERAVKAAMMECANQTAGVTLAEKLTAIEPFVVAPASRLTTLITESHADKAVLKKYRQLGITVATA